MKKCLLKSHYSEFPIVYQGEISFSCTLCPLSSRPMKANDSGGIKKCRTPIEDAARKTGDWNIPTSG
jgi:hypothetical protein